MKNLGAGDWVIYLVLCILRQGSYLGLLSNVHGMIKRFKWKNQLLPSKLLW